MEKYVTESQGPQRTVVMEEEKEEDEEEGEVEKKGAKIAINQLLVLLP
jgi:hypothetical protein